MSFFCCNKINLSRIKNFHWLLNGIGDALKKLSKTDVDKSVIMIGGNCHKKYYSYILKAFYSDNSIVYNAKNANIGEFLCNLKYNLCNYGLFFCKENGKNILKIYSGNCVILNKTQQNFIEKNLKDTVIFKENENAKFSKYKNFYKLNYVNFNLICKNSRTRKQVKSCNKKSEFKVVVLSNLKYFMLYKNKKIDINALFKTYKKIEFTGDDIIKNLIQNNNSKVANKSKILYNKNIYSFDILKTLNFISEKTNDNNFRKLVLKIKK